MISTSAPRVNVSGVWPRETLVSDRVSWLWSLCSFFTPQPTSRHRKFSILRNLGLASLVVSVMGQHFPMQLELSSLDGTNGFVINGEQSGDRSGVSVSNAGDVNGDGIADFLIGAYRADPDIDRINAGKAYVVFGKKGLGDGGILELSNLMGIRGFVLNGEEMDDECGYSVSTAGDVNNDGITDFLIGARDAKPAPNLGSAGKTYVVFGKVGLGTGSPVELSDLDNSNGYALKGEQRGDAIGYTVSSAGDVNGDGVSDFVIGARFADPVDGREDAGKTYVVFGKSGLGDTEQLDRLNGTNGFVLNGVETTDRSGWSVSTAGDINADGIDDILIGARGASPNGREDAGKTYVVFGKSGLGAGGSLELSNLDGSNGFVIHGEQRSDLSGYSVSRAGDVNADNIEDLLIGAAYANPTTDRKDAGKTYVVFGKSGLGAGGTFELSNLNGVNGFVLNGDKAEDFSGWSVSCAGDVNGDEIGDFLIGARGADPAAGRVNAGKTYVVFGKLGLGVGGTVELSSLNGINGFVIHGENSEDLSGDSVSGAGDVNADGIEDFLIGARFADPAVGRGSAGKTYVVFGRKAQLSNSAKFNSAVPTLTTMTPTTNVPMRSGMSANGLFSTPPQSIFTTLGKSVKEESENYFSTQSLPLSSFQSSSVSSVGLAAPLAAVGGVCAIVCSIVAALAALRSRRKRRNSTPHDLSMEDLEITPARGEYTRVDSLLKTSPSPQSSVTAPNYALLPSPLSQASSKGVAADTSQYQKGNISLIDSVENKKVPTNYTGMPEKPME